MIIRRWPQDEPRSKPLNAKFTKGAHAIRVVMVGDDLDFDHIEVSAAQAEH